MGGLLLLFDLTIYVYFLHSSGQSNQVEMMRLGSTFGYKALELQELAHRFTASGLFDLARQLSQASV